MALLRQKRAKQTQPTMMKMMKIGGRDKNGNGNEFLLFFSWPTKRGTRMLASTSRIAKITTNRQWAKSVEIKMREAVCLHLKL